VCEREREREKERERERKLSIFPKMIRFFIEQLDDRKKE